NGNCSAIAIIAAGGPTSFKAVDTEPGVSNSWKIPVPPTTVNQNVAITGAMIATDKTSSRIVLPLEIRAVKIAIMGPYPINHAKKNTVQELIHDSSLRKVMKVMNWFKFRPNSSI